MFVFCAESNWVNCLIYMIPSGSKCPYRILTILTFWGLHTPLNGDGTNGADPVVISWPV
ncbi:hypothetical protein D4764_11G0000340 [Takifugu flavidus]|uniref:Uncharacterized protein n=1 Tax=Takifugu flavidus TaxID=433684 RepID=A0A5C6PEG6_9TELE|nr:hypothetical protein D4764_11G0000340 [Takifugu flavidus]